MKTWLVIVRYSEPGDLIAHYEYLEQESASPAEAALIALGAFRRLSPDYEVDRLTVYELADGQRGKARHYDPAGELAA